jgi:hypothetical protein
MDEFATCGFTQYHELHQYPIRYQILKCRAFPRLITECDADDKLSIE